MHETVASTTDFDIGKLNLVWNWKHFTIKMKEGTKILDNNNNGIWVGTLQYVQWLLKASQDYFFVCVRRRKGIFNNVRYY